MMIMLGLYLVDNIARRRDLNLRLFQDTDAFVARRPRSIPFLYPASWSFRGKQRRDRRTLWEIEEVKVHLLVDLACTRNLASNCALGNIRERVQVTLCSVY